MNTSNTKQLEREPEHVMCGLEEALAEKCHVDLLLKCTFLLPPTSIGMK